MIPETKPPPVCVLWFRESRRQRWQEVYRGTSQECTGAIGIGKRTGDWLTMPIGENPNRVKRMPA